VVDQLLDHWHGSRYDHQSVDVFRDSGGRLWVVAAGVDRDLQIIHQTAPNSGWSGWKAINLARTTEPSIGQMPDGQLQVFARGEDGEVWSATNDQRHFESWNDGRQLVRNTERQEAMIVIRGPVVARNSDGRLEVFVIGADSALWHIAQTMANDPDSWSPAWQSLGGSLLSRPVVVLNEIPRLEVLEVFAIGSNSTLWHNQQTSSGSPTWQGWELWDSSPAVMGTPAAISPRVVTETVARRTDCLIWRQPSVEPLTKRPLGDGRRFSSDPVVATNSDGRLEVFARGDDAQVWHIWQPDSSNDAFLDRWQSLGGTWLSGPVVGQNDDGRLEVFAIGTDSRLWHIWQDGGWSSWHQLGGTEVSGRLAVL
jgi:hypothetical protein